jgi:hypothetical protein
LARLKADAQLGPFWQHRGEDGRSSRALSADRGQFEVFTPSIPARKHDRYSVRPARCRPVGTLYIGAAATQLSY